MKTWFAEALQKSVISRPSLVRWSSSRRSDVEVVFVMSGSSAATCEFHPRGDENIRNSSLRRRHSRFYEEGPCVKCGLLVSPSYGGGGGGGWGGGGGSSLFS